MKSQVQYKKEDGEIGIALIHGPITSMEQAKRELANQLDIPVTTVPGTEEDLNSRLRNGGVDPRSVLFSQISE